MENSLTSSTIHLVFHISVSIGVWLTVNLFQSCSQVITCIVYCTLIYKLLYYVFYYMYCILCVCLQDFVDTLSDLEISDDDAIDQLKHFHSEPYDTVSELHVPCAV